MSGSERTESELRLAEAVEGTVGIQPWRRVFHAANGTLIVLAIGWAGLPLSIALPILGGMLFVAVIMDLIRLLDPKFNVLFFRTFSSLASPRERKAIASSTWYTLSALLVLLLFPEDYALAGILVLAWADPAASIVGQLWGKTRFLAGSVRGSGTFVLVGFLVLLLFVSWPSALVTALATGIVEALPVDLDDNLLVPIAVAGLLLLTGTMTL